MKRIILFRYHKKPLVCRDRLRQLQANNPGVKIYGLYGGKETEFNKFTKVLGVYLEHNYCIKNKTDLWKWKNSDLAVRLWFKDIGTGVEFDMLHLIEWDLLLFGSLDEIYSHIPANNLGLTALTPLVNVEATWSWTSREPRATEWRELLEFARTDLNYNESPFASLGPGPCLPRKFLEKYVEVDVPDLSNDELRLPLFGQALGFQLSPTGFYEKWSDPSIRQYFNCHGNEISLLLIEGELSRKDGRKAFHPYRKRLMDASSYKRV